MESGRVETTRPTFATKYLYKNKDMLWAKIE